VKRYQIFILDINALFAKMKITDRAIGTFEYLCGNTRNVNCTFSIMCVHYFDHMNEKKNHQQ